MTTVAHVAERARNVLTDTAEEAALVTGFVRRTSKLTGSKWAQAMVFVWMADPLGPVRRSGGDGGAGHALGYGGALGGVIRRS